MSPRVRNFLLSIGLILWIVVPLAIYTAYTARPGAQLTIQPTTTKIPPNLLTEVAIRPGPKGTTITAILTQPPSLTSKAAPESLAIVLPTPTVSTVVVAPSFTPTDAPTSTPTPALPIANSDANLRSGPGTEYDIIGSAPTGQLLEVIGRNEAGDWLALSSNSWIATFLVDNAPQELPVNDAPPTPTPWPTATFTPVPPPTWTPTIVVPQRFEPVPVPEQRSCCRICTSGKACGDSCISASKTCHKGGGCACNG